MMHTGPIPESAGTFDEPAVSERPCPKCGGKVTCETWDSNDGAYTDYKYTCTTCGKAWWVDGIDS